MLPERKKWKENFSEWYRWVLYDAEVIDYRYPVKGCGVWRPYGFKIRKKILDIMRKLLDETGHDEILAPMLIPEDLLKKEAEHIRGFEEEVFWVTRAGGEELEKKLALRPTSETALAPMFELWIHSHKDLPLKVYQVVSIFRYETKATKPLLRLREVTTFKEAHTAHATKEEAEEQVKEAVEIYKKFFDELGIPYLISKRPEWDKFPGAEYSIAFDTIFPDGRTLQIGTAHLLGQKFAKAFGIKYETKEGKTEYVWQTSYGISDRVVASVIVIHGDDHGMVLPPSVAPIEVVVVPIPYKGREDVVEEARKVGRELKESGFSVVVDDREDVTPGSKFYYWELRGVPVRVEVGPRDVDEGTVTLVRRDTLEKKKVGRDRMVETIRGLLADIQASLKERAWKEMQNRVFEVERIEEAKEVIEKKMGVAVLPWCGKESCGLEIQDETGGRVLGIPVEGETAEVKKCPVCGAHAHYRLRIGVSY